MLVIISAVIIGIFNYILTLQKRRQFDVMKAIGMKNSELAGMVISEVCIISLFAAALALGITFFMASMMPEKMPFYLEVPQAVIVSAPERAHFFQSPVCFCSRTAAQLLSEAGKLQNAAAESAPLSGANSLASFFRIIIF